MKNWFAKIPLALLLVTLMIVSVSKSNEVQAAEDKELTYDSIIEVEDWGPAITKVIVDLGTNIPVDSVDENTFNVHVVLNDPRLAAPLVAEGDRTITKAYVSTKNGTAVKKGNGSYVVLEMEIGPDVMLGNAMNYDFYGSGHNDWVDYTYTITQVADITKGSKGVSDLVITTLGDEIRLLVEEFNTGEATYNGVTLTYADYSPEVDKKKNPLFIWLHGAGEGGTDPTVAIGGNKVVNFAADEIQSYFDGAYILAPQTPTFWMDSITGETMIGDGTSFYSDALMSLIEEYVAGNPDIDPNRIYIGGDSNGGYMTMLMLRDYPDYFAAGLPTAEALKDSLITDEDIASLAKTPTWFVHAKNDTVVDPNTTVVPTYNRLVEVGAEVYFTYYDDIHDLSGLYQGEDGEPYQYMGHWSWIPVYNNDPTEVIDGKEVTIMEWLASQTLADDDNDSDKEKHAKDNQKSKKKAKDTNGKAEKNKGNKNGNKKPGNK